MENEVPQVSQVSQGFSEKGSRVTTPILWAVVALAYMFEIGAVGVVIKTEGQLQYSAAIGALVMPVIGIVVVFLIRAYKEELFYPSPERQDEARGVNAEGVGAAPKEYATSPEAQKALVVVSVDPEGYVTSLEVQKVLRAKGERASSKDAFSSKSGELS